MSNLETLQQPTAEAYMPSVAVIDNGYVWRIRQTPEGGYEKDCWMIGPDGDLQTPKVWSLTPEEAAPQFPAHHELLLEGRVVPVEDLPELPAPPSRLSRFKKAAQSILEPVAAVDRQAVYAVPSDDPTKYSLALLPYEGTAYAVEYKVRTDLDGMHVFYKKELLGERCLASEVVQDPHAVPELKHYFDKDGRFIDPRIPVVSRKIANAVETCSDITARQVAAGALTASLIAGATHIKSGDKHISGAKSSQPTATRLRTAPTVPAQKTAPTVPTTTTAVTVPKVHVAGSVVTSVELPETSTTTKKPEILEVAKPVEKINKAIEALDFTKESVDLTDLSKAVKEWYSEYKTQDPDYDPSMPTGYAKLPRVEIAEGLGVPFVLAEKTHPAETYASPQTVAFVLALAKAYQHQLINPKYAKYQGSMLRVRDLNSPYHASHTDGVDVDLSSSMYGLVTTFADGPFGDHKFSKNFDMDFTVDLLTQSSKFVLGKEFAAQSVVFSAVKTDSRINALVKRKGRYALGGRPKHLDPDHYDHIHNNSPLVFKLPRWANNTWKRWGLDKDLRIHASDFVPLTDAEYKKAHGPFDAWRAKHPEFGKTPPVGYKPRVTSREEHPDYHAPTEKSARKIELGAQPEHFTPHVTIFRKDLIALPLSSVKHEDNPGPGHRGQDEALSDEEIAAAANWDNETYKRVMFGGQDMTATISVYGQKKDVVVPIERARLAHYQLVVKGGKSVDDMMNLILKRETEIAQATSVPKILGVDYAPSDATQKRVDGIIDELDANPIFVQQIKDAAALRNIDYRILLALYAREGMHLDGSRSIIDGRPLLSKHLRGKYFGSIREDIAYALDGGKNFDGIVTMMKRFGLTNQKALTLDQASFFAAVYNQWYAYAKNPTAMPYVFNMINAKKEDMAWKKGDLQGVGGSIDKNPGFAVFLVRLYQRYPQV